MKVETKQCGIFLIRHAKTKLNKGSDPQAEDRFRGWVNVPLSPEGKKETHEIAQFLVGLGIEGILTSDLERAVETAEVIADKLKVPILKKSRDFRPWNVGEWAGQSTAQLHSEVVRYIKHTPDKAVPGGESFHDFAKRLTTAMRKVMNQYLQDRKTLGIVSHYRDLKLVSAWVEAGGYEGPDFYRVFFADDLETGGVYRVFPTDKGWDWEITANSPEEEKK